MRIVTIHGVLLFEIPRCYPMPFFLKCHFVYAVYFLSILNTIYIVSCRAFRESILLLECGNLFQVCFTFTIINMTAINHGPADPEGAWPMPIQQRLYTRAELQQALSP